MIKFAITIDVLESGWADLSLLINGDKKTLYFENIPNDAIYELLVGALKIAGGIGSAVIFHNASQKTYLTVNKAENGLCRLEIDNDCFEIPVKQFCKSVLRMFDKYVFAFSKDEYTRHWGGFPERELERLREAYHS